MRRLVAKPSSERLPPKRSAECWAREFVKALRAQTGVVVPFAKMERIAAKDKRLRERIPASVVAIVEDSARTAGLSVNEWIDLALRHFGVLTRTPNSVRRALKELNQTLRIGDNEALRLIKREPILLGYAPRGIARRVKSLSDATGLSLEASRRCTRRCPKLLTLKPATLAAHVRDQRRILGLTILEYRKVVLREPRLLVRSPDGIVRFLKEIARFWGLSRAEALTMIIKAPSLAISSKPSTMDDNLTRLAEGFGCEKRQLIEAAKSFPMLAYQKPERLIAALKSGAKAVGVGKKVLVSAVLRAPSLLARRTDGWSRRMQLVVRIARVFRPDTTASDVLTMLPAAMTYGRGRLLQRYVIARLGLWSWNWPTLLTYSDVKVRMLLEEYFEAYPERAQLRKALQRRSLL